MLRSENRVNAVGGGSVPMSLDDVRVYMGNHYNEPLSIDHLARLTGLSPNYFGEAFKKAYGQSAMDYVTELRIGHAKRLLRESDLILREIARKVGYSDEFYFSRKFKKAVGVSPSAYSREQRRKIAVASSSAIGNLLPLGLLPVAAPLDPKWSPYYYHYYRSGIKVHLDMTELALKEDNFRKLLSAKPDVLLVQDELPEPMRRKLDAAGIECLRVEAGDWRGQLRETAAAFGKESLGEDWISGYDAKAAGAKESVRRIIGDDLVLTLRLSGTRLYLYSNRGIRDVLYRDLALRTAGCLKELGNDPVSLDELLGIDPDRVLLFICPDANTRMFWLSLQYDAKWKRLRAVKNGNVAPIPSNPWFEYSAVAVARMLEETLLMLTGKSPIPSPVSVHGILPGIHL